MSRADKRRLEKMARKAAKSSRRVVPLREGAPAAGGVPEGYLDELIEKGVQLHLAGRGQDAENIYRQILAIDADHADANHLLGGLACQSGNGELAIGLILRAIARAPDRPMFHFNLGTVYQSLGRVAQAAECHRAAIARNPRSGEGAAVDDDAPPPRSERRLDRPGELFHAGLDLFPRLLIKGDLLRHGMDHSWPKGARGRRGSGGWCAPVVVFRDAPNVEPLLGHTSSRLAGGSKTNAEWQFRNASHGSARISLRSP